jgi:hypothetical protein
MQPPATGATHGPFSRVVVVENIDGDNVALCAGRAERRIIRKAKVLAKPDNNGILIRIRDSSRPFIMLRFRITAQAFF